MAKTAVEMCSHNHNSDNNKYNNHNSDNQSQFNDSYY